MNLNWDGLLPILGDVIVVEDDPTLRMLMAEILAEIGAKTLLFETADDALMHLLTSPGDCPLVIVDHGLPGQIQGIEFIALVMSRWPAIQSILTSGYSVQPAAIPTSTIYLHKPWSLDDLVVAVASLLQPGFPICLKAPLLRNSSERE